MNLGRLTASARKVAQSTNATSRSGFRCLNEYGQQSRSFNNKAPPINRPHLNSQTNTAPPSGQYVSTKPHHEQSPPYKNLAGFLAHHIPSEDTSRTVKFIESAFAIEDDLRELFEEENLPVDRMHMCYNNLGMGSGLPCVVLDSPESAAAAVTQLNGVALFGRALTVNRFKTLKTTSDEPDLSWGWFANASAKLRDINLRYPRTSPPTDIFVPFQEGRHVCFSSFPPSNKTQQYFRRLYALLHSYDILCLGVFSYYFFDTDLKRQARVMMLDVGFVKKEDADLVCHLYDQTMFGDTRVRVKIRRPPMRVLGVTWDKGHNGAHYQPRDLGSAKGTNFESEQLSVYRKWLLKDADRGLWVPGHKY